MVNSYAKTAMHLTAEGKGVRRKVESEGVWILARNFGRKTYVQIVAPQSYYGIQVGVFYERNANTAMFTNISLTRELYGNVYTYDANGNVTAVKDLSNQKSAATYDSFDNLLSYVQPGSAATEKYLFTYGSTDAEKKRHLPLTSTTPMGVKTATEYNAYGSTVNATVQENASAPLTLVESGWSPTFTVVLRPSSSYSKLYTTSAALPVVLCATVLSRSFS